MAKGTFELILNSSMNLTISLVIISFGQDLDTCIGKSGDTDIFVSYHYRQKTFPEYRESTDIQDISILL